jgi:hypothetical protein
MPKIAESQNVDLSKYMRLESPAPAPAQADGAVPPPPAPDAPSAFMRCPMPPISRSVDGLRQFYRSGVPQTRLIAPNSTL